MKEPCPACRGQGRVVRERTIEVKIPPGVAHGTRLRIQGEGEAGLRGGPPGDLYVVISIRRHKLFRRERDDLIYELPLQMAMAALGTEVEVPTRHSDDEDPRRNTDGYWPGWGCLAHGLGKGPEGNSKSGGSETAYERKELLKELAQLGPSEEKAKVF